MALRAHSCVNASIWIFALRTTVHGAFYRTLFDMLCDFITVENVMRRSVLVVRLNVYCVYFYYVLPPSPHPPGGTSITLFARVFTTLLIIIMLKSIHFETMSSVHYDFYSPTLGILIEEPEIIRYPKCAFRGRIVFHVCSLHTFALFVFKVFAHGRPQIRTCGVARQSGALFQLCVRKRENAVGVQAFHASLLCWLR